MDEIVYSRIISVPKASGGETARLSVTAGADSPLFPSSGLSSDQLVHWITCYLETFKDSLESLPGRIIGYLAERIPATRWEAEIHLGMPQGERCLLRSVRRFHGVVLALGSNVGKREENITSAVRKLTEAEGFFCDRFSSLYESAPAGYTAQGPFINMALLGRTALSPRALLDTVKEIEVEMGRTWSKRNRPRPIDIDIIYYDREILREESLQIPHRERLKRDFVLLPLTELLGEFRDPETGVKIEAGPGKGIGRIKSWGDVWKND